MPRLEIEQVRWQTGDDPTWRSPELDDGPWSLSRLHQIPEQTGLFWIRAHFELEARHTTGEPLALRFVALATCELFWDGLGLETGGRPGRDVASEEPGPIEALIHLPAEIGPGTHVLAGRCSTHHRQLDLEAGFMEIAVGPYLAMAEESLSYSWSAMASLSAKFVAAIYFFSIFFFGSRPRPALFLALLSLSTAALLLAEVWRPLIGYTYDWHIPRLMLILGLAWASNLWLLLFFFTRFPFRGRWPVGLGALVGSLVIPMVVSGFDNRVAWTFLLGLAVAFLWGVGAILRREKGSGLATAGVGLCLLAFASSPFRFIDQGVFFAFDGLIALLIVSQVLEAREKKSKSAVNEETGSRSENEKTENEETENENASDEAAATPTLYTPSPAAAPTEDRRPAKLTVRLGGRIELVDVDSILYVRGAGDYSALHLEDGRRHLHDKSLKALEALLPDRFARVHRSYLVDIERVRSLSSHGGGRYRVQLGDVEVPVSRQRVATLRRQLGDP